MLILFGLALLALLLVIIELLRLTAQPDPLGCVVGGGLFLGMVFLLVIFLR